jgi:formate dehydrogenase subunit beta
VNPKGAILPSGNSVEAALILWLKATLNKKVFDALLIPVKVPAGDSFAYLLLQDPSILDDASPLPPVMPLQGGKAISRLTMRGKGGKRVAAVVRPCEARAAIELTKLKQAHLEDLCLITMDCPGVLPLSDYLQDPSAGAVRFAEASSQWDRQPMRPTCQICTHFSIHREIASDLHIGTLGNNDEKIIMIPVSRKGERILENVEMPLDTALDSWAKQLAEFEEAQALRRRQAHLQLKEKIAGPEGLLDVFSNCINCHNCQRVCPVCYCRQCYFDSAALQLPAENYLARAARKGALRFPPDTLLFHIGRASHMALSCVSCGACEDACPMDIPVAQVFSLMADQAQETLGYVPGRSLDEPLPLTAYEMDELHQVEQPYIEIYQQEVQDA